MPIPIIDLFAGPGGLGEGFSSYTNSSSTPFRIALSVEKDPIAHKTLKTRALFRQFKKDIPEKYYEFLRSDRSGFTEYLDSSLFKDQIRNAELEARKDEIFECSCCEDKTVLEYMSIAELFSYSADRDFFKSCMSDAMCLSTGLIIHTK